jgi:hypothetical protein
MKFVATTLIVFGCVGAPLRAQTPAATPTVDQVIEKHVTAIGGRATLEKLTSRVSTGTIEIPDAGLSGTIQISEKAPDKSLTIAELPGVGLIRDGVSPAGAWEETPQTGLREKTGAELADAKRGATFNAELKLKTLYKTVELVGKERVGTFDTYVLNVIPAEGAGSKMYFDAATGLLMRQTTTRDTAQGPIDVDVYFEDYRAVQGVKMPFTIRQVTAQFTLLIKISDVKLNVSLDDAIFRKPGTH